MFLKKKKKKSFWSYCSESTGNFIRIIISSISKELEISSKKLIYFIKGKYEFHVFNKNSRQQIKWSIVDPNEAYEAISFQDYSDNQQEWFVSYLSPYNKDVSQKITLSKASGSNWIWYALGAGAVGAAVGLAGGDASTGDTSGGGDGDGSGGDTFIDPPPNPSSVLKNKKKVFKLSFGINL